MAEPSALTVAIVLGRAEPYDRFSFAYQSARKAVGSQRKLAAALGVHPSALARSNFTLTTARRRQAALLCGVPPAFLQEQYVVPLDLPNQLHPLHTLIKDIHQVVKKTDLAGQNGWSLDARISTLKAKDITPSLPQWRSQQVEDVLLLLQAYARKSLELIITAHFPTTDWLVIVDCLVHHCLAVTPGNLHSRPLQIAKNIHRLLSHEKAHHNN
jgi:hypothetical protein